MLFGELKFAIGEHSSRRTSLRRTLVRGGWFSSRERIFWRTVRQLAAEYRRTVRQFAAEYGLTRANSAELRRMFGVLWRTFAGVRRSVGVGKPMANSRGVRSSSPKFAANDSSQGILPLAPSKFCIPIKEVVEAPTIAESEWQSPRGAGLYGCLKHLL